MSNAIDYGQEGGVVFEITHDTMQLTITRTKRKIEYDVPMLVEELGIKLAFARKPCDWDDCSGAGVSAIMVTQTKQMMLSEYLSFVKNIGKPYSWLKGKGGIYRRELESSDTAWVPQPQTRDYRLCVEVTCPGMPILYIDPQGGEFVRYLARLG